VAAAGSAYWFCSDWPSRSGGCCTLLGPAVPGRRALQYLLQIFRLEICGALVVAICSCPISPSHPGRLISFCASGGTTPETFASFDWSASPVWPDPPSVRNQQHQLLAVPQQNDHQHVQYHRQPQRLAFPRPRQIVLQLDQKMRNIVRIEPPVCRLPVLRFEQIALLRWFRSQPVARRYLMTGIRQRL